MPCVLCCVVPEHVCAFPFPPPPTPGAPMARAEGQPPCILPSPTCHCPHLVGPQEPLAVAVSLPARLLEQCTHLRAAGLSPVDQQLGHQAPLACGVLSKAMEAKVPLLSGSRCSVRVVGFHRSGGPPRWVRVTWTYTLDLAGGRESPCVVGGGILQGTLLCPAW